MYDQNRFEDSFELSQSNEKQISRRGEHRYDKPESKKSGKKRKVDKNSCKPVL
jgi:hypothetical protein